MIYGYIRVSTVEQASSEKTSLADQERVVRGRAAMSTADEITIFSDPGVSGSVPLDARPAGIRMLAALKPGDIIVASKLDRLFRSTLDALSSVEDLQKRGVGVVLLDISAEPVASEGVGKLFFSILAAVAEFERSRIIQRMNEGRSAKLAKGGYNGGRAPYGFKPMGQGSHAILVEHDREMRIVDTILGMSDKSLGAIRKELDERGLKNRLGKSFGREQIRRIIRRPPLREAAE